MARALWPPRSALRVAFILVALLTAICVGAWLIGGPHAVLGVAFGALSGLAVATADLGWGVRVALAGSCGAGFALGVLASPSPVASGAVVAMAALAQVPFTRRGARVATMLPVVAALGASLEFAGRGTATSAWVAGGVLAISGAAAALGIRTEPLATSSSEAVRHSVATALVSGVGLALARALDVGHGYWLVLAAASVLAVSGDATGREAVERVGGTLAGVVIAVLAVAALPPPAIVALAAATLVLAVAWTVAHEVRLAALSASAVAVLLGSGGLVGASTGLALERLTLTAVGAVLAAATAAVLWRLDTSPDTLHHTTTTQENP